MNDFSQQVLARVHGMARVRICKSRRCQVCKELPRERPATPTAENNVLLAMRAERIRQELLRTSLQAVVPKPSAEALSATQPSVEPARPLYRMPAKKGYRWGAVGNLLNHALGDADTSVCGKFPVTKARFDLAGYHYCKTCREVVS